MPLIFVNFAAVCCFYLVYNNNLCSYPIFKQRYENRFFLGIRVSI